MSDIEKFESLIAGFTGLSEKGKERILAILDALEYAAELTQSRRMKIKR